MNRFYLSGVCGVCGVCGPFEQRGVASAAPSPAFSDSLQLWLASIVTLWSMLLFTPTMNSATFSVVHKFSAACSSSGNGRLSPAFEPNLLQTACWNHTCCATCCRCDCASPALLAGGGVVSKVIEWLLATCTTFRRQSLISPDGLVSR